MLRCATCLILICFYLPSQAADRCTPGHELSDDALQNLDLANIDPPIKGQKLPGELTLSEVRFFRQDVFPFRDHWLARSADRLHMLTREEALYDAFILNPGQQISEANRAEAERELRGKPYLYDAAVLVRRICNDQVDLDVVVRDVWTLTPGITLNRSGGDDETSISLADVNVLGSGKSVTIEYFDDRDRTGTLIDYADPNLFGSRWSGRVLYTDNDDGEGYSASLLRPFYSLDTRWSFGMQVDHFVRTEDLEFLSSDLYEYDAETDTAELYIARSSGRVNGDIHRWFFGLRYIDEEQTFPATFPGEMRTSRKFTYPYVGWQFTEDDYARSTNLERVGITEDIKLGWNSYVELGWSTDSFGGEGDHLLSRGSLAYRRLARERHLFSVLANASGRFDLNNHKTEDLVVQLRANYLWYQAPKWRLLTRARYLQTRGLSQDKQLTLGGDSGLRAYPSRYQPGDRSLVLTVEQRYYSGAYPFGLFRLGYAAFVDVGRAWFHDSPPQWIPQRDGDHFDTLANIGLGLRLESVRTRRDRVFHIDLSHPLVDGPDTGSWEVTVSGKQSF